MFLFSCRASGFCRAGFHMEDQRANSWPMSKPGTPWTPSLLRHKLFFPKLSFEIPVGKTQLKRWLAYWVPDEVASSRTLENPRRLQVWKPSSACEGIVRRTDVKRACLPERYCWPAWQCSRLFNRKEASFSLCQLCTSSHLSSSPPAPMCLDNRIKHGFKESQLRRGNSNWGRLLKREPLHWLRSKTNLQTRCIFVTACWHMKLWLKETCWPSTICTNTHTVLMSLWHHRNKNEL